MQSNNEIMEKQPYQTSSITSLSKYIGRQLSTISCIVLYCIEGRAIAECNFTEIPFRKGDMAIIFTDTHFLIRKTDRSFKTRFFELSISLADEATFISTAAFFNWIYEYPVFAIPEDRKQDIELWLTMMDWIENNTDKYKNIMLRNHWHNFFLGIESVLKSKLTEGKVKTLSASHKLITDFYKLLAENCRINHEVKFYAERLCVTPYYLSRTTQRIFSITPKEIIDRQIVMEIKSLLTSTDFSIKEIANMYHFESSSYLGRYFRRHIGMTPSEYRNLHS